MKKFYSVFLISTFSLVSFSVTAQWQLTGNSTATASSKLGTTNAVPLVMYTANTPRMVITAAGRVGINVIPFNIFSVKNSGGMPNALWSPSSNPIFEGFSEAMNSELNLANASGNANQRPLFLGKRSRGTLVRPTLVQNRDFLTTLSAGGFDGSTFQSPASIDFLVDGPTMVRNIPTRISLSTGINSNTKYERLGIGSNGNFNFNNDQLFIQQSPDYIGIGTTNPMAKVDVYNANDINGLNVLNTYAGNVDRVGISSYSVTNPGYGVGGQFDGGYYGAYAVGHSNGGGPFGIGATGVYGEAIGGGADIYGVFGYGHEGLHNYGVVGYAGESPASFNAAGFFIGDVFAANYYTLSDRKFKTDINPLKNPLDQLLKLKPSSYTFKKSENLKMGLPEGKQIGLIADEVKAIFPELVKEGVKPAQHNKERKEVSAEVKYESVNYVGLIPVLIGSIQEQQKQMNEQQKQIDELRQMVLELSGKKEIGTLISQANLDQNTPNPLSSSTNIRYSIPPGTKIAQLVITDMSGKIIKQIRLGSALNGNINLDAAGLLTGTYNYSLFVDGNNAATKKMIVSKIN